MRKSQTAGVAVAAAVVLLLAGAGGVAMARPAEQPSLLGRAGQQGPAQQRELLEALARLANVTLPELRATIEAHGGVVPALESLGVTQDQVLGLLAEQMAKRYEPAVAEGRLTPEQAERLAHNQARRLLRKLGGMTPRGR